MGDYTQVYNVEGSFTTSAAVTGGTLAVVSGDGTVATAGAGAANVIGVFASDAGSGKRVTVILRGPVHEVANSGGVTAGAQLISAAAGKVASLAVASGAAAADINAARQVIGVALTTAADLALVRYVGV
jgi:hypothetical protein